MGASVFIDQLWVDTSVFMANETFRVLSANQTQLVLKSEVDGQFRLMDADEFYGTLRSGTLVVGQRRDAEALLSRVQRHLAEDFDARTDRELAVCRRRAQYTAAYFRERPASRREIADLIRRVAIEFKDPVPPCVESLYNWVRLVRAADGDQRDLTSVSGRKKREGRLPRVLRDLMDELITERYMRREGPSFCAVTEELHQRMGVINAEQPPEAQLPMIDRSTFLRYRDAAFHPYEIDAARKGKAYADRRWAVRHRSPRPERRLDKVQIDSTVLDLILVDETGRLLGRPWVTAAIDLYSRVILAVVIGFAPPSIETLSQLLRMMCMPKGEILAMYGLKGEGFHGRPCELVVDNALEFHSDLLKKMVTERLGMIVTYQPKGEPWWKAMIERWFGTYQRSLIHTLPGTTFANPQERRDYDSEAQARLTLEDVRRATWTWLEQYHNREHSELNASPASVWNASEPAEGRGLADIRDLDCLLSPFGQATIASGGIKLHGLWYDSDELRFMLPSEGRNAQVDVRFDPANLGSIYFRAPHMPRYVRVPATWSSYAEGLSLTQHGEIQRLLRNRPGREDDCNLYLQSKAAVLTYQDALLGDSRNKRKRGVARMLNASSELEAAQRTRDDRAPPTPVEPLPDPLEGSVDFDPAIPDFDGAAVPARIEQASPDLPTSRLVKVGKKRKEAKGGRAPPGPQVPEPVIEPARETGTDLEDIFASMNSQD